jgi:hypothetical protein
MKKIKTLSVAEIFFKTLMGLTILISLFVIFIFIHSKYSPDTYNNLMINNHNGRNLRYMVDAQTIPDTYAEWKESENQYIYYNLLTSKSKRSIILPTLLIALFTLLILKELVNFVNSIKNYSSFHNENSKYFKRMAKYFSIILIYKLIFFIPTSPLQMAFPDNPTHLVLLPEGKSLNFLIFVPACLILCLVISKVFKEGERLRIENELTI